MELSSKNSFGYTRKHKKIREIPGINKEKQERVKKIYTLKKTRLKPVGAKTKRRIAEHGKESDMFLEIWNERDHVCEICDNPIFEVHSSCFAHILSKRNYPDLRYNKKNIALVHGIFEIDKNTGKEYRCHQENDRRNAHRKQEIIEQLKI